MIDANSERVMCDLKKFCFTCTANPILENPDGGEKTFYHCSSCDIDILCDTAIGRQFDKRTKKLKKICPRCRENLQIFHYPLIPKELEN